MSRRARRPRRRVASRVRDYARGLLAFLFSNVGIIVLVVAYTIAGAFMFQAIEGAGEVERANNMTRERNNTADYLWENVTIALNLFNDTALKERIGVELVKYQRKVVVAARGGWDGGAGGHSSRQWSFSSAFLYSLTVITTIGYGHLSPRTNWGKVTTILYALLGMPLFLLYLSNVGELLARWFKCLYALVCLCRGCPGFTRRRITRFRHPIEMSEAESIERPQAWRSRYSDSDVTPEQRIPPYPRGYQRKAEYFRSASMPQPWESGRHPPPLPPPPPLPAEPRRMAPPHWEPRGLAPPRWERRTPAPPHWEPRGPAPPHWEPRGPARPHWEPPRGHSEPLGFRSGTNNSSEFSYVTFDAQAITVPISVCVSIMVGYLLFGSMIFGMWEKWDQLDGAYFCFISLSSIGFGDFVPGERVYSARIEPSFIVCSLYLMLGMALVAMCFNLMQEQVIHYFAGLKRALKRICRCKR